MGRDTSQGLQLTTTLVKKNLFLSLSQINLEAILTSATPSLQESSQNNYKQSDRNIMAPGEEQRSVAVFGLIRGRY